MKALIVCLSSDLPVYTLRDSNTIYFVYNKLEVFIGQTPYSSNFSIVENMPQDPVMDHLYIDLSDGLVKVYDDYSVVEIARVQTEEMWEILKQAGTIHFYNSKEQYLDTVTRMLVIPFSDGKYTLTVDIPNDLLYNENTITKFNPETGQFEIYGETFNEDPLETKGWRGKKSSTVDVVASDGHISASVRISKSDNNIIKVLEDGLYAYPHNTISQEEFDSWKAAYEEYKSRMEYYLGIINKALEDIDELINKEEIDRKIHEALETMYPTIDQALEDYELLSEKVDELFDYAENYTDEKVEDACAVLEDLIQEALDHPWGDLTPDPEPEPEEEGE